MKMPFRIPYHKTRLNWIMNKNCHYWRRILTRKSRSVGWEIVRMLIINMQCISFDRREFIISIKLQWRILSCRSVQEFFSVTKISPFWRKFSLWWIIKFSVSVNINDFLLKFFNVSVSLTLYGIQWVDLTYQVKQQTFNERITVSFIIKFR